MKEKKGKSLSKLVYTIPLIIAASFLPLKKVDGQMTKIPNSKFKAIEREMRGITRPNGLYLGVNYTDLDSPKPDGYEAGYSRKLTRGFGLYSFLATGKYMSPYRQFVDGFNDSHADYFKISLGGMFHDNENHTFITAGPAFTLFNKKDYTLPTVDKRAFRKLSFEVGGGGYLGRKERVGMGFAVDPVKWEGKIYLHKQF